MATLVVTPRTDAECNQLQSVLHSKGRVCSSYDEGIIRKGEHVVLFTDYHNDYFTDTTHSDLIEPKFVPVNAVYELLQQM